MQLDDVLLSIYEGDDKNVALITRCFEETHIEVGRSSNNTWQIQVSNMNGPCRYVFAHV